MEIINKATNYIQNLNKKQLEQHILLVLGGTAIIVGGLMYFIYAESNTLIKQFKKTEELSKKSISILADDDKLNQEARYIQDLFEQSKDFTLESYFETFCKEEGLSPEAGWSKRIAETNDRFEEHTLTALFKHQTMEKLVKILTILEKKEIIYFKNIAIKSEGAKKISFELTLATKIMKSGFDQKGL